MERDGYSRLATESRQFTVTIGIQLGPYGVHSKVGQVIQKLEAAAAGVKEDLLAGFAHGFHQQLIAGLEKPSPRGHRHHQAKLGRIIITKLDGVHAPGQQVMNRSQLVVGDKVRPGG